MDDHTEAFQANSHRQISPQSDIDATLRRKRKSRGQKACYPCRQRKVKCSYETPCRTCIDREHPELCSYDPSPKRANFGPSLNSAAQDAVSWMPSKLEWDRVCTTLGTVEQSLLELRQDIRHLVAANHHSSVDGKASSDGVPSRDPDSVARGNAQAIHTNHDLTGETVYLGSKSVPAMVLALEQDSNGVSVQDILGKSVLPIFGLDNESATYPFVDLWGLPHGSIVRVEQLCKLLPSYADCLQLFRHYRDTAHVLYPGVADIQQFESDLTNFLTNRASGELNINGDDDLVEQKVYGKNLHWVGLLFAILASGCQCSGIPRKERQLTCQVYVCCAYECLRIINYLSHSTLVDIQNLLVLGNVISNNMNAGVAWSLLGLTIRLAQSLGLDHPAPPSTSPAVKLLWSNIWWQIIWQDSLLSITYDRASSTATTDNHEPSSAIGSGKMSYAECMRSLCKIGLDIVRERAVSQSTHHQLLCIVEHLDNLKVIMNQASDHLRDVKMCRSMKDQLEYWNLYLHWSYVTSELCRPTINPSKHHADLSSSLRKTCIESLANTVEAFLGMQNITNFASQSWAAVHRSLSSALLLGILGEPARNERARKLLGRLVATMSSIISGVDPSELSTPITRSIAALHKLNSQELSTPNSIQRIDMEFNARLDYRDAEIAKGNENPSPYSLMDTILWGKVSSPST